MMRKGSALLIVLGMMAFMVVSAVAFSMFMRQSRLPSSFLRQRLTASQLVKAGLAGAMQRLDAGIGDNPFPGVGETGVRKVEFKKKDGTRQTIDYGNFWHNRVFLESRLAKDGSIGNDDDELDYDTVSTLTLEALAYIPPPLVNTVRFWSKRTSTAAWASLGYDAGRYAFTAVNVSDYFDINRIRANVMRDSSPENRISLGYLFENDKHTGPGAVSPADFDAFLGKVTNDVFQTRFVSLADYNLALGSGAYGNVGFASPFWKYLENGGAGSGGFYDMAEASLRQYVRPQKFVAGSWFPGLLDGDEGSLYLTDETAQPLYNLDKGLDPLMKNGGEGFNEIKKHLNLAERTALRDYIDEDNVPTSLALPTLERAPMLTGLQIVPLAVAPPKIVKDGDDVEEAWGTPDASGTKFRWVHRVWKLDSLGELKLMFGGSAVYPFKRKFATDKLGEPTSFDVQILVKAFLSKADQALTETRVTGNGSLRPGAAADWKDQPHDMNTGLFTCLSKGKITVKPALTESDALCTWSSDAITLQLGGGELKRIYGIKFRKKMTQGGAELVDPDFEPVPDTSLVQEKPLMLRDAAGNKHPATEFVTGNDLDLKVNFAVWIRVMDGNDTVDMVPAMIADDQIYNVMPKPGVTTDLLGEQTKEPIMPVDGPLIKLEKASFKAGGEPVNFDAAYEGGNGLKVYCNDPRYNWAPEDWYAPAAGEGGGVTISAQDWYDRVKGQFGKTNDRSKDLFQFVSNMGYLQSMGEIQFLPLVRNNYSDFTENNAIAGSFYKNTSRYDGQAFDKRSLGQLANNAYMWKTRFAFGNRRSSKGIESDPYEWNVYDTRGGVTVSPYGDKELMMAALANTPYDYCVASADNALKLSQDRPYTFGPGSTEAMVEWEELLKVAEGIKAEFENSDNWQKDVGEVFSNLTQWDDDKGPFGADFGGGSAGDADAEFHDVDRKFLYSYWRSCFANTQQLFLIFVRAEPSVMGGSSAGHTPSQLGARAVALVWREPESSITDSTNADGTTQYPHRMRILFYHQFE